MAFFGRYRSAPQLLDLGDNTYVIVGLNSPSEEDEEDDDEFSKSDNSCVSPSMPIPGSEDQDGSTSLSGESAGDTTLQATGSSSASPSLTITDTPSHPSPCPSQSISRSGTPSISPSHSPAQSPSPMPSPDVWLRGRKKTRPAPLPPSMLLLPASSSSPFSDQRHSYALDGGQTFRHSTDSDSITSEPQPRVLFYQTSTDSGEILPESARGSNFPGELAGVDHLKTQYLSHPRLLDDHGLSGSFRSSRGHQFPRDRSALFRLREAFRSPQVGRKRSKKGKHRTSSGGGDENFSDDKSPRSSRLLRAEDALNRAEGSDSPKPRGRKSEDGRKSPKPKKRGDHHDPSQDMSDWIIPRGYQSLELEHEFERKNIVAYVVHVTSLSVTKPSSLSSGGYIGQATTISPSIRSTRLQPFEKQEPLPPLPRTSPNPPLKPLAIFRHRFSLQFPCESHSCQNDLRH
ncbi:hypothetical protein ElyMa_003151000 [Elysia marginata]|uniref:Uncharacterized protein n=1 Tax=Elysia marginata TaxID=1093978 RepID=A0AAV4IWF3_9GAST|nr:hypothetical protein ElyMa_003151000 [Elysia marginata]